MRFAKTILTLCALTLAGPAAAAVQIFDFVARIDTPDSPYGTGTMISGSFSYDDALMPTSTYSLDPAVDALYRAEGAEYLSPTIAMSFEFGGQSFSGGGLAGVFDMIDQGFEDGDFFFINASQGDARYFFSLYFWGNNATTFFDTRLPTSFPPDLWLLPYADTDDDDELNVPNGEFSFYDAEHQSGFNALLLSITPAGAVPEPSTWVMLIVGFGAIGGMLRRTRRPLGSFAPSVA